LYYYIENIKNKKNIDIMRKKVNISQQGFFPDQMPAKETLDHEDG